MPDFNKIILFITSEELQRTLLPLKIFLIIIIFFFVFFLIFFLIKSKWLKLVILYQLTEFLTLKIYGAKRTARVLKKIAKNSKMGRYKEAVIMADKELGKLLERLVISYEKNTFEERLDWLTQETFSNIEQLKEAHQIRKKIREDSSYQLNEREAKEIISAYETAFKELEIIK